METKRCRFCGSDRVYFWTDKPKYYVKCFDCNFISVDPLPSQEELDNHYSQYHDRNHQASAEKNLLRLQSYNQEISWLISLLDLNLYSSLRPLSVFDYGCSGGYFLDALRERLHDVPMRLKGDDKSPPAVKVLKDKGYYIDFENLTANNWTVDLIILRGVIEHVPDFKKLLQSLSSRLSKGGYLFITATPNGASPCATLYRHNWIQHHYPSHIQHFSSHHLDYLGALNGLERVDSIDFYTKSPYKSEKDVQVFVNSIQQGMIDYNGLGQDSLISLRHAFFESMLTILYKINW